ncbi:16640_t:CDS:2, partial [Racocetra persica]
KRRLNMVAQLINAEASTFYVVNSETGTSYAVNAEVSIPYTVMIDQVANIESSTSYVFTAEAIIFGAVNAKFSIFYVVSSYMIDTETNALCKNAVYDEATTEEVNSIGEMQHDFSLLKLGYMFLSWDDVEAFLKLMFGGKYIPKKSIDINAHRNRQSKRKGFTTFVNTHNHKLDPEKCKYNAKFRSIGDKALNDIEFYTKNRNLSITIQHQLLKAKYPDTTFLDMNLTNAIQHYKVKSKDLKNDASQLLLYLTEKRSEESGWSVEF